MLKANCDKIIRHHSSWNQHRANLRKVGVRCPPLPTQRKIAGILSAYDDLIENNTRRIKILEEMARTIYREWFVEFRAPGVKLRKATPEEKKVTGKDVFPVGWEMKTLGDHCPRGAQKMFSPTYD